MHQKGQTSFWQKGVFLRFDAYKYLKTHFSLCYCPSHMCSSQCTAGAH